MTDPDPVAQFTRELLEQHAANVGAQTGAAVVPFASGLGGGPSGARTRSRGARAGARGARRGARRLGESRGELTLTSELDVTETLRRGREVLEQLGDPYRGPLPELPSPEVWGLIYVGLMNAGLVVARIGAEDRPGGCSVQIHATALEGLIKHRMGPKTVTRVHDALAPLLTRR